MTTADFTVEVRDRDFQRLGQIAPEFTDLKFIDSFNGVGTWEMKLPAEHPRLADAKAKGSGLVITEHWTTETPNPPIYSPWTETRRNLIPNPAPNVYAGSGWQTSAGSFNGDMTDEWVGTQHTTVVTAYLFTDGFSEAITTGDLVTMTIQYRVNNKGTATSATHIRVSPHIRAGNIYIQGAYLLYEPIVEGEIVTAQIQWVADRDIAANELDIAIGSANASGSFSSVSNGWDFQVRRPTIERGHNSLPPFTADTNPNGELERTRWLGAVGASASVTETRIKTPQPPTVNHHYRVYSGRMRSAKLSQSGKDPQGTWVINGVHDNVIAAATKVFPDPANAANAQTASHWEQAGAGETVMKLAVQLNAGSTALASRQYPWLTIAPNLLRGLPVKCSSRFDTLGDLLTSLATTAGLGWRFAQTDDTVTFDVFEPADKTKLIRLDIRNGGVESNELGFTAPSATDVLVMGQGEGAERTIIPVTTTEAQDEATAWGIRWETTKDQRQTNDPTELTQAGEEDLATAGATVNSLKVVPSDAPNMRLGIDWYIGDRITVTVEGQEAQAIVTQVATSITKAGVIRTATIGDPVGFDFDAKIVSKVKDHDKRIGQVERLIGQGTAWDDVSGKPATFPSDWPTLANKPTWTGWQVDEGRGTTAQRDAFFGVPATDAERAALANRQATWFNTDFGWEESYYAVTGLAGLTARGLVAGTASDWYPTGRGPECILQPTAQIAVSASNYVQGWPGIVNRHGGAAWFTNNSGAIFMNKAGHYDLRAWTLQQAGSGTANYHLVVLNNAGTTEITKHDGGAFTLVSNLFTTVDMAISSQQIKAGEQLLLRLHSGSLNVHASTLSTDIRGQMIARYVRPALVTT